MSLEKIEHISILIAEDEKRLLDSMVEYLQLFFSHVYATEDGESAYALYQKVQPDILIADIHMPRLDGLSLIEKIRRNDKETKIIITTAHSDKEKLLQAIELNLVKYLIKPVQTDMLKSLLFSLVEEIDQSPHIVRLPQGYRWQNITKTLHTPEGEVILTPKERKVLSLLIEKAGETVSSYDIYNHLYEEQPEREYSAYAITSLIKRLRQKLPKETLKSIYGVGYMFIKK